VIPDTAAIKALEKSGSYWARLSLEPPRRRQMEATRITVDEVRERLDRGEEFTFVDTRNPTAWGESDKKLPHAIRVPAEEVAAHLNEIPRNRTVVTYCT